MKTSIPPSNACARAIAEKFRLKYWRACKLFQEIYPFHKDYPAFLIFHDPKKWERYKKIIKNLDEFDVLSERPTVNPVSESYLDAVQTKIHAFTANG